MAVTRCRRAEAQDHAKDEHETVHLQERALSKVDRRRQQLLGDRAGRGGVAPQQRAGDVQAGARQQQVGVANEAGERVHDLACRQALGRLLVHQHSLHSSEGVAIASCSSELTASCPCQLKTILPCSR